MKAWTKLAPLAAVTILAVGQPAAATHGGIHPTFQTERVYFHCAGPTKVQNVNLITDGPASWDTNAPTQSVQQGAGCGYLDPGQARGGNQQTIYDAPFVGKFKGNLQSITVELHNLLIGRVRQGSMFILRVRGSIDGTNIFPETAGQFVNVTPVVSSTGLSEKLTFTIKGLGCAREVLDADGNVVDVKTAGFATEDGAGESEHELVLTIDSGIVGQTVQPQNSIWVYDTTEVPAGLTFNPTTEEASTVRIDNPATC